MIKMLTNLYTKLNEAIQFVNDNKNKGCVCPCCGQIARMYKRKLNSGMAIVLLEMYKYHVEKGDNYFHIENHLTKHSIHSGHDWALLVNWDLIREMPKEKDESSNSKTSGMWKITNKGKLFIKNTINVPTHILMYNNMFEGFSDTQTSIKESLDKNFNYDELMNEIID